MYKLFIITFLSILIAPHTLFAVDAFNSQLPSDLTEQLSSTMTPEKPAANQEVVIKIQSYSSDLNKARIVWYVNGVVATQGTGITTFTFSSGNYGTRTTVRVVITKEGGKILEKTFVVHPAEVDLIYEANTYVPPFYKGKALFSHQSQVKIVALPRFVNEGGAAIPASNLVYKWRNGFKVLQDQSGFGKNVLIIDGPLLSQPMDIEVEVSAIDSTLFAKKKLRIEPTVPFTLLYEKEPLNGYLFNRSVTDGYQMFKHEATFAAFPYYFATNLREGTGLDYTWLLNGEEILSYKGKSSLTIRNVDGSKGSADIGISTSLIDKLLQQHRETFEVYYEGAKASAF